MDKSTLSNYGWVVIVTLVLAVMLALATPFGSYVGKGASNVIKTFANSSKNAIDEDNIDTESDNWDRYFIDNEVNHALGIHEGGSYTTVDGETVNSAMGDGTVNFPSREPQVGDTYVYGDYEYKYGYELKTATTWNTEATSDFNGWGVRRIDVSKESYGLLLKTINNKPLKSVAHLFQNTGTVSIVSLSEGFTIPDTVTNMEQFLYNQRKIETLPSSFYIPDSVRNMHQSFVACKVLKEIPGFQIPYGVVDASDICRASNLLVFNEPIIVPNTVTRLYNTFAFTTINADVYIPESVTEIDLTFNQCTFGENVVVTIDCNPTIYDQTFLSIKPSVKITGKSSMLSLFARVPLRVGESYHYYDPENIFVV